MTSTSAFSSRAASAVQRGGIGDLPAEEARAPSRHRAVDDDALLAVVHPERQQRWAALHRLQADQSGPELPPIVQIGRTEPDISQSLHGHRAPPLLIFYLSHGQILRSFAGLGEPSSHSSRGLWRRWGRPSPTPEGEGNGEARGLTSSTANGVYVPHEHPRTPNPSLVAHLLKVAGAIPFFPIVGGRHRRCDGLFVCPVWRSLGKFRKRIT